jgi:hypothetical protein
MLSTTFPLSTVAWTGLGPAPVFADPSIANRDTPTAATPNPNIYTGRITAIAADPIDVNTFYIGEAGGGVWKTTDGGGSWSSLTDNQTTLTIGALAVSHSNPNVIYAGTGEANFGPSKVVIFRDNVYYGEGILKSGDGGAHWTLEGNSLFHRRTISRIIVDPANSNIVYAAVGAVATNGLAGNTGIWKSTDGGASWLDTTLGISTTAAFSDLSMDSSNNQTLYAAVGDPYGNTANGIYKTTDGGADWTLLSNFPTGTDTNVGRITIAEAPSSPQVLYASIANVTHLTDSFGNSFLYKMLRSADGGGTWSLLSNTPNFMGAFGDYNTALAVDPNNSNLVYAGGQAGGNTLIASLNAGFTWTDIGAGVDGHGPHVDHHAMVFDASGRLLEGNDGGVWRLDDANFATLHWTDLNSNLSTIQIEGLALDPTNPNVAYAGAQDNFVEKFTDNLTWNAVEGGDGGNMLVDPNNPSTVYHDAAVGSYGPADYIRRSDDGGINWVSITTGINAANEPSIFYPPLVMDPTNPSRLLTGTSRVYESLDRGDHWNPLSTPGLAGWTSGQAITAIGITAADPNTIYAAAGNKVFVSSNHGNTWAETDPVANAPDNVRFRDIAVDPIDASIAYTAAFNFGSDTGGAHFWKTTNGGLSWIDISGNLPDVPVRSLALVHHGAGGNDWLFAGTDRGLFASSNGGAVWSTFGTGFPNAMVTKLVYAPSLGILAAGTNGRSVLEISLAHLNVVAGISNVTAGVPFTVTVSAVDIAGNVISGYRGTVHFATSDPGNQKVLPPDYAFAAIDHGVHSFANGFTLVTAGTQAIIASDVASPTIAGGTMVSVQAAAASGFRVTGPTSSPAGVPFSITVRAVDAFNNPSTTYTGTVHFTSSDSIATLPASYSFVAGDQGVHTFSNLVLRTNGSHSVTVTDTFAPSRTGGIAVNVVPSTITTHFQVTVPVSAKAGVPFSLTVTAIDSSNRLAVGYTGTIHFTSGDAQATLPPDFTFAAGDNGTHTFANVILRTPGSQEVDATDVSAPPVTGGASLTIVASLLPSHFSITVPAQTVAGDSFSITVTALTSFDQVASDYQGTIHFSSSDGIATLPGPYTFTSGDQGVHTFSGIVLRSAGSRTVSVTDQTDASISGSASINVKAGSATHLGITAPVNTTAGAVFAITVTALDAFGNKATTYLGMIHFGSNDSSATLPADYTFVNGDQGAHAFGGIILRTPGNATLAATDAGNSSITGSAAVTVLRRFFLATGADAGGGPEVKVFDPITNRIIFDFYAYDPRFNGGVRVAVGDVTGDGVPDIVTAPGPGGGPDIRVFDGISGKLVREFMAYSPFFTGGVYLAAADVNNDGVADIITGADAGGGPHVEVFSGKDGSLLRSFYAYDRRFNGGVRVAGADLNHDGMADIITAPGAGGGPDVRIFSGAPDHPMIGEILAYDATFSGGVYVAVGDTDHDGVPDIITGSGRGMAPLVKVFSGVTDDLLQSFNAFDQTFQGGVRVGWFGDQSRSDIIAAAGPGGSPHVKAFDEPGLTALDSFYAYDPLFNGGVFVGGQ